MTDDKDIQELLRRKERALSTMGGPERIAAQHDRGRMTARERILALLDKDSCVESVGFIASNPYFFAGSIDVAGCDKATHFTCLCEAFNIPLIFLQDVPGFFVGKDAEHAGIITKILRWFQALALVTVPKITIVIRKARHHACHRPSAV